MNARIRDYCSADQTEVVDLSLRAWASVFASLEQALGADIFLRLYPDWRERQAKAVRKTVATGWLRDSGAGVALVETGGDQGYAPARRVYEKAGYTMLPVARYFMAL